MNKNMKKWRKEPSSSMSKIWKEIENRHQTDMIDSKDKNNKYTNTMKMIKLMDSANDKERNKEKMKNLFLITNIKNIEPWSRIASNTKYKTERAVSWPKTDDNKKMKWLLPKADKYTMSTNNIFDESTPMSRGLNVNRYHRNIKIKNNAINNLTPLIQSKEKHEWKIGSCLSANNNQSIATKVKQKHTLFPPATVIGDMKEISKDHQAIQWWKTTPSKRKLKALDYDQQGYTPTVAFRIIQKTTSNTNVKRKWDALDNENEWKRTITSIENLWWSHKNNNTQLPTYTKSQFIRVKNNIIPPIPISTFGLNTHNGTVRNYNEDTLTALPILNNTAYFFAIYDGHGGKQCSHFLQMNLHFYLTSINPTHLRSALNKCDNDYIDNHCMCKSNNTVLDKSGSCAVIVIITNTNKIITLNVGDSRALLISSSHDLLFVTEDHKPSIDTEKERIIAAGGNVYQTPLDFPLIQNGITISMGPARALPGKLSVSRSFGDIVSKHELFGGNNKVITSEPDIKEHDIKSSSGNGRDVKYVVLACDGVFDVWSNDEIISAIWIAKKRKKKNKTWNVCAGSDWYHSKTRNVKGELR